MQIKCSYTDLVDLVNLVPHPKNSNNHPEKQIEVLAKIIKARGMRHPIIVSKRSGFIIAGHGRLMALKLLGVEKAPIDYQDFENEADEIMFLEADNHIAEFAEHDKDKMLENLKDLDIDLAEFDFEEVGLIEFELPEVEIIPEGDEDAVPELKPDPIAKRGDIWLLGNHRLMCGDSTMIDDVEKLMNSEKADMVFTDPPYNVAFNGRSGKHDVIKNDKLSKEDFSDFIREVCQVIRTVNPKDYYIWCNWKFYGILQEELDYKSCIVWAKNNFGMGNNYRHQHEFCIFNGDIDSHVKNESDLWEIKKDSKYVHPTQKPVALSVRAFSNHIKSINILDLFGGSGSTLIGAEQTGRKSFLMELDEKYCDVIIKRWQEYADKEATLETTGETYNSMVSL